MNSKMNRTQFIELATSLITAIAAILVAFGVLTYDQSGALAHLADPPAGANAATARGTSHFASIAVDSTFNIDDTSSSLTGSQTLTPAASFYAFDPSATLTLTLATGSASAGDLLLLQNLNASASVVIVDTGATIGGGAITLGTNDTALFLFANSKWTMLATANNS